VVDDYFGFGRCGGSQWIVFGLLGDLLGLSPSMKSVGIAASVGITAAVLIARRRAAINEQKNR
jgi:hypothetical protein